MCENSLLNLSNAKWKLLVLACLSDVLLSACQGGPPIHSVEAKDNSSSYYSAIATVRPESWHANNPKRGGAGIEFGYEYQSGQATQYLYAPSYIQLDPAGKPRVTLTAFQDLQNTANVRQGYVAYNYLWAFKDHLKLELDGGIGYDKMNLHLLSRTDGTVIDMSRSSWIGVVGVTPRWSFNDWFAIEGRMRFGLGRETSSTYNPALLFTPAKHIAITTGYAWRNNYFSGNRGNDPYYSGETSDIELNYSGPSIGLRMTF